MRTGLADPATKFDDTRLSQATHGGPGLAVPATKFDDTRLSQATHGGPGLADPAPMTERPRPAKLELLVRRDDESFEVREIGSSLGFLQSRPQRIAGDAFEISEVTSRVAGGRTYILKNTETDRFLLLSEHERFLWEQMDGNTSLQEIATAYVLRYG